MECSLVRAVRYPHQALEMAHLRLAEVVMGQHWAKSWQITDPYTYTAAPHSPWFEPRPLNCFTFLWKHIRKNLGERHKDLNMKVHEATIKRVDFDEIKQTPEESDVDKLFKIAVASKYMNIEYIIDVLKCGDPLYISKALKCDWIYGDNYAHIINPRNLQNDIIPYMSIKMKKKMLTAISMHIRNESRAVEFYNYCVEIGCYEIMTVEEKETWALQQIASEKEILGKGQDYLWYKFINFEKAFKEMKRLVMITPNRSKRADMILILIESAKTQRDLETLLKYFYERHINEQKHVKENFLDKVLRYFNVYEFDKDCWEALNIMFHNLEVYSSTDYISKNEYRLIADVAKECLRYFNTLLDEEKLWHKEAQAIVHALFQLGDLNFKVDLMKKFAPSEATINHSEIDEKLLRIQMAICSHILYSRPPIPLECTFMYLKGDYVPFCLPIFNALLSNLPVPLCMDFVENLLNKPVSIQKHGIRLAFECFNTENFNTVILSAWNKTKNVSLRLVIFDALYSKISSLPSGQEALFETLKSIILRLQPDDDDEIFNIIKSNKLPEHLVVETIEMAWKVVSQFPPKLTNLIRMQDLIICITNRIHQIRQDIVSEIVDTFVASVFKPHEVETKDKLSYEAISLIDSKWQLTVNFLTYVDENNLDKKIEVTKLILMKSFKPQNYGSIKNRHDLIDIGISFISQLEDSSYNQAPTRYITINKLMQSVIETLQTVFATEEIYILIWKLQLGIVARKTIIKPVNEIAANIFARELGNLVKEFIDKELFFNSFLSQINYVLQDKIQHVCRELLLFEMTEIYWLVLYLLPVYSLEINRDDYVYITTKLNNENNKEMRFYMYNTQAGPGKDEATINHSEIDEKLLRIQMAICSHILYSRPPIPLECTFMYLKGDYVPFCLPIFNALLSNLPVPLCMDFVENLLNKPVSIQKHGIRLAFECFNTENFNTVILSAWNKTKNVSLRLVIFDALYSKISSLPSGQEALFETLKSIILRLQPDDDDEIFNIIKSNKLPEHLVVETIEMAWKVVSQFPPKLTNLIRMQDLIICITNRIHQIRQDIVSEIVDTFVALVFKPHEEETKDKLSYEAISLIDSKWQLTASFLTYVDENNLDKKIEVTKLILMKSFKPQNYGSIKNRHDLIDIGISFISQLEDASYNQAPTRYVTINKLMQSVIETLQTVFATEEIYILIWKLQLGIVARKTIIKPVNEIAANIFARELGNLVKEFIDKELFFNSFLSQINYVLQDKIEHVCRELLSFEMTEIYWLVLYLLPVYSLEKNRDDYVYITTMLNNIQHRIEMIILTGKNLGERHKDLNSKVHEATAKRVDFDEIKQKPEESDADKLFKIAVASKYMNIEYIIDVLKCGDPLYISKALRCEWIYGDNYAHIINPHEEKLWHKEAQAIVHALFQLGDLNFKVDLMKKFAPSEATIDHSEIDEKLLHIQMAICSHILYSRPPIPLECTLMYIKGDYVPFCLPIFDALLSNLPLPLCIHFVENLLNKPVSIQKHGIRLVIGCLNVEKFNTVILSAWNKTKNVSLRVAIFDALYSKISTLPSGQEALFETLKSIILRLRPDDDDKIFNIINSNELPEHLVVETIETAWKVVSQFPPKLSNLNRMRDLINCITNRIHQIRQDIVSEIVDTFVALVFKPHEEETKDKLSYEAISLIHSKWQLTVNFLTYVDENNLDKKIEVTKLILMKCFKPQKYGSVENKHDLIDIGTSFISQLEDASYNQAPSRYVTINKLMQSVIETLQTVFAMKEIYILIWKLQLGIVARKTIIKPVNEIAANIFARELGNLVKEFIDKELFFNSFLTRINDVLQDKIQHVCRELLSFEMTEIYWLVLHLLPVYSLERDRDDYVYITTKLNNVNNEEIRFYICTIDKLVPGKEFITASR
ncbi:hypothetical protein HW555_004827 [Spodoptera exigua]|uniref:Uncharacterized protein n=1 Tax=Spodoptera exigua TaxID=7107 RepID=A0A835GI84_SPOEX|nr:hypothetical protein HW555_004827 [Spodoptera exigua]